MGYVNPLEGTPFKPFSLHRVLSDPFVQGMRLAPNDAAPERGLLEKSELMEEPMLGPGRFRKDGVTTSCISCGKLKRT